MTKKTYSYPSGIRTPVAIRDSSRKVSKDDLKFWPFSLHRRVLGERFLRLTSC
jgi:hypothetical protein